MTAVVDISPDEQRLDAALELTFPASDPIAVSISRVGRSPGTAMKPSQPSVPSSRPRDTELLELIDSVPEHVFALHPDFTFLHANRALLDYHGQLSGDVPSDPDAASVLVHHPDDISRLAEEGRRAVATGSLLQTEARVLGIDGTYRWFLIRVNPLRDEHGCVIRWYGTRTDIDDRKRAEAALQKAHAALMHVTRVTTVGEVTASFAHELNQPLAAIVNNANACLSLTEGRRELEEVRAALADIVSDAERASCIIERVRALTKHSMPERVHLRLTDVVDDVIALAAAESAAQRVAIRTDVAADLPIVVGDRVQLQQVLLNLVVNAMDAMASVDEAERRLEIRGRLDTEGGRPAVTISVEDRGIGLHPEQTRRVFDAFYTTKPHGMGLGLAISRAIVQAHGGRLWAEPNRERGATFAFRLAAASE